LKKNEGFMCIVPGTTLTRRPALRTNHAGAVPSAGTARKKGAPFCASAPLQARWHDPTRHEEATVPLRAGPNRARAGLGPGGPFGILYSCLLRSTTTVFLACTSVPSSSRIHGTNASDRSSCRDKMQHPTRSITNTTDPFGSPISPRDPPVFPGPHPHVIFSPGLNPLVIW
jgi:hypothetical protein